MDRVDVSVHTVPTDAPEADGTLAWDATSMVLVQVRCDGEVGTGWTYGPAACAAEVRDTLAGVVLGADPMDVAGTWQAMVRAVRNDTRRGVAGYAVSAVDTALWDLKARLLGLSLSRLLGRVREDVPVYASGGFTTYDRERTQVQLEHWVQEQQIPRVKIKIGQDDGAAVARDLERVRLARHVVGEDVELFVDANGAYGCKQAIRVAEAMEPADVVWFEEPVTSDDLAGLRQVRDAVRADVTAGEYAADLFDADRLCEVVDCLQLDLTRVGGISEWQRACAVAAAHAVEVSGHCAPNLHAHVAAATPGLRHLEWFHDHDRIERLFFDGALDPAGGAVRPDPSAPGNGLTLRRAEAERFRVG